MSNDINHGGTVEPTKVNQLTESAHTFHMWSSDKGQVVVVVDGAPQAPIKPNPERMKGLDLDHRIFTC